MVDSILTSIKGLVGVTPSDTNFDNEIVIHINSALMVLQQLGVGPSNGFYISSDEDLWNDLLVDRKDLEAVKTYIYLKVKLVFDPPQNSFLVDSIKNMITELEFRLNAQVEGGTT